MNILLQIITPILVFGVIFIINGIITGDRHPSKEELEKNKNKPHLTNEEFDELYNSEIGDNLDNPI